MFIDVTRHGSDRVLRVAATAIAYLDECDGGTALHLAGGQSLRVNESPAEIEARVAAATAPAPSPTEDHFEQEAPEAAEPADTSTPAQEKADAGEAAAPSPPDRAPEPRVEPAGSRRRRRR